MSWGSASGPPRPRCDDCLFEAIRDTGGAFVRWKLVEACVDHFRGIRR